MSRAHKYIFTLFTLEPESMCAIAYNEKRAFLRQFRHTLPLEFN